MTRWTFINATMLAALYGALQTSTRADELFPLEVTPPASQVKKAGASEPSVPLPKPLPPLAKPSEEPNPNAINIQAVAQPDEWAQPPIFRQPTNYGDGTRYWTSGEILLWGIKGGNIPVLVNNAPIYTGSGVAPGTSTLIGGNTDYDLRLGGRFTMGTWLDPEQTLGLEGSFFFLNGPADNLNANSAGTGNTVIGRPFTNAITGLPDSQQVSVPGITSGNVGVTSTSALLGAQLNGIYNLFGSTPAAMGKGAGGKGKGMGGYGAGGYPNQSGYRVDMIGGFMYLNLNESVGITENITALPTAPNPPFFPGSGLTANDRFATTNNFYGGQLGARGEVYSGAWFTNVTGALALGDTNQNVRINGSTVFTNPNGSRVTQPGGVLALPSNIGNYSRDQFAVVPQVSFNVGRQLTENMRFFVGYTFIYWSNVVRPGDQIDPTINTTQFPTASGPGNLVGPARPAFAFHDTDFWAQGISFGLELRR